MANSNRVEHASETWLTDATVFEVNRTPAHSNHKWFTHDPQSGEYSDLTACVGDALTELSLADSTVRG